MIDLEDLVARKNYTLKCDWLCDTCGNKTEIVGISLKGEKSYGTHQITWNDIIHKRCNSGHISIPVRNCTRCNAQYPFDETQCDGCDKVIERMIEFEDEYIELSIKIKKLKRKKEVYFAEDIRFAEIINRLKYIGYSPCVTCDKVMTEKTTCDNCED